MTEKRQRNGILAACTGKAANLNALIDYAADDGLELVRTEGRLHSPDAAAPGHQKYAAGANPAGVHRAGGTQCAGREVQHRPDHHTRGRPEGHVGQLMLRN